MQTKMTVLSLVLDILYSPYGRNACWRRLERRTANSTGIGRVREGTFLLAWIAVPPGLDSREPGIIHGPEVLFALYHTNPKRQRG